MGLESGTWVDDLNSSWPLGTDPKSQGDNHFQLIKSVLKNAFTNRTRKFSTPSSFSVAAGTTSVLSTYDNLIAVCNTGSGNITLNLPSLVSGDAGWCLYVQKQTTDANTIFLVPPSGTINGFTKVRR